MTSINLHFDNVYLLYINNNELTNMKYKLSNTNIKVQYFKGYNGSLHLDEYNQFLKQQLINKRNDKDYVILTKGQYGHIRSFINILLYLLLIASVNILMKDLI
jgi:RecA-family ATPase